MHEGNSSSTPQSPLTTFLCHSNLDKIIIQKLAQRLREYNIDPWLDSEKLLAGQDWRVEIENAVRSSDVILVCLSNNSVNKAGFVQREIRAALEVADLQPFGAIFLIPLRLDECSVPANLKQFHWINYYEKDGYYKLIRGLENRANSLGKNLKLNYIDKAEPATVKTAFINCFLRYLAMLVDLGVLFIFWALVFFILNFLFPLTSKYGSLTISFIPGLVGLTVFYAYIFLSYKYLNGSTIGKLVFGLTIIDKKGEKPNLSQLFLHYTVGYSWLILSLIISMFNTYLGLGSFFYTQYAIFFIQGRAFFDQKYQGFHNKFAGTYVIVKPKKFRIFWRTFFATCIDIILIFLMSILYAILISFIPILNKEVNKYPFCLLISLYIYTVITSKSLGGSTVGQIIMGIKIVDKYHNEPTIYQFILRYGICYFSVIFSCVIGTFQIFISDFDWIIRSLSFVLLITNILIALLWPIFDPKKQGLHDKIAKTYVIIKRKPKRTS